jgi:protein-disulfide isomerase
MRRILLLIGIVSLSWLTGCGTESSKAPTAAGGAIVIEVFSDYQCPACKQLHETTLRQVEANSAAAGKVKLVHREFPLPTHAHALEAAKIAQGAKALNKYNAVADALFKDQADWGVTGNMTKTLLAALSTSELDRVRQAAEDPAVMKQIEADKAAGQAEGVNQTPTMVIRHKGQKYPIAGIVTYEVFSKFLDNLLNS